ncbi:MFS general substrate transporter [Karstenula rhodostoma CBS 690.94]|uniref:MFS general substrate transporter n=1 Tax=Karstenula rhodostoma CBS 690.94 TaxID=1392251 RepID=A0A9P4PUC9_9PLEO|nr:MFS general substrate transporter [Karstenula rhodostoma CBS 690.94]
MEVGEENVAAPRSGEGARFLPSSNIQHNITTAIRRTLIPLFSGASHFEIVEAQIEPPAANHVQAPTFSKRALPLTPGYTIVGRVHEEGPGSSRFRVGDIDACLTQYDAEAELWNCPEKCDGKFSHGWRWIFIVEGATTIVAGFLSPIFLIDFPEKASFLTDRQEYIATSRVSLEKEGTHAEHITFKDSLNILWDWKIGVYSIQSFVVLSSIYSLNIFLPIILQLTPCPSFSYALSQLLCAPPYIFGNILPFVFAYFSDKHKLKWPMLVSQSVSVMNGLLIAMYAKPPGICYFGIFLAAFGTQANVLATLVYGQNQTAKIQKRAIVAATIVSFGGAGGIYRGLIFRSQNAPWYLPGI